MRRVLTITACTAALILAGASTASACPRPSKPAPGTVKINAIDRVLNYELTSPYDPATDSQTDRGEIAVTYTCTPNSSTRGVQMNVLIKAPSMLAYQQYSYLGLACDGRKHTETFVVSRNIGYQFTPAKKKEIATATIVYGVQDNDPNTPEQIETDKKILVRYVGW